MITKTERFIWGVMLFGIVLLGLSLLSVYTDWDAVCTSSWRFLKTYMGTCILMGYPIF